MKRPGAGGRYPRPQDDRPEGRQVPAREPTTNIESTAWKHLRPPAKPNPIFAEGGAGGGDLSNVLWRTFGIGSTKTRARRRELIVGLPRENGRRHLFASTAVRSNDSVPSVSGSREADPSIFTASSPPG